MKFSTIAAALYAVPALAAPALVKRDAASDTDLLVLQFALTLEHLEDFFYSHGLRRLSRSSFFNAGYDQFYYDNLKRITDDEKDHVALLTSAIKAAGGNPVNECNYTFQYDTVQNFVTLSSVLEGVGTSAYLGGAPLISNKDYLTVAGSILVTESLHTAYQRNAVKEVPFATPYGTPLDPTSVFTLAASFIIPGSCRNSDYKLPFTPYPALASGATGALAQGATATFTANTTVPANSYLTFVYGLSVTSVKATGTGSTVSAAVPSGAAGQVYVLLTSGAANGTLSSAGKPIAGPAIIEVTPAAPMFLN